MPRDVEEKLTENFEESQNEVWKTAKRSYLGNRSYLGKEQEIWFYSRKAVTMVTKNQSERFSMQRKANFFPNTSGHIKSSSLNKMVNMTSNNVTAALAPKWSNSPVDYMQLWVTSQGECLSANPDEHSNGRVYHYSLL